MDFPSSYDLEHLLIGVLLAAVIMFFLLDLITKMRRAWLVGTLMSWMPLAGYYWIFSGSLQ